MCLSLLRSLGTSPRKPHHLTCCPAQPGPDTLALAQGLDARGGEPGVRDEACIWRFVAERHVVPLLWIEIRFHHLTLTCRVSEQGEGRWCQPGPASQLLSFLWLAASSFMDLPMSGASHCLYGQDSQAHSCRRRSGSEDFHAPNRSSPGILAVFCDPAYPHQPGTL